MTETFIKHLLTAQESGHEEVIQRPQLTQMILHRRARQAQTVARVQLAYHLRGFGVWIFDILRFVQNQHMVMLLDQMRLITRQQRIGREDNVIIRKRTKMLGAFLPMQGQHLQRRGKLFGFAAPVMHQRRRCNNQHRTIQTPCLFFSQHMRQRLRCFAQAHIIGQNPTMFGLA